MGVVPVLGYLFKTGCGFMDTVFYKGSFVGELFLHFRIYGYDFQKFLRIHGHTFQKFLWIYALYFCNLNGTTPYLGNSSDPPGGI